MLLIVASCTALSAVFITYCAREFTDIKFTIVTDSIKGKNKSAGTLMSACATFVGIAVAYGAIAGLMASFVEPTAAGSGISEIKTILNGVRLPKVVNVKTLVSKV